MTAPLRWPAKALFFADALSILAGFVVFRALCSNWPAPVFARWEWLRVVLGLCLLLPRNGLDVVAQRCAVRHPGHLREWTAISLICRVPLAVVAIGGFLAVLRVSSGTSSFLAILLALSLPLQAVVPDLAARVQGRYALAGVLQMARNVVPAVAVVILPVSIRSPENMAAVMLMTEAAIALFWWIDAAVHGGLPGGRWLVVFRRGGRAVFGRSLNQTLSRWLRVLSWNADAFLLGMLATGLWATVAPARSLMMSAVFPIASYLGALSPLLARESQAAIRARFLLASKAAFAVGGMALLGSLVLAPWITPVLFGPHTLVDGQSLVLMSARLVPVLILLCATNFWTTLRRDDLARTIPAAQVCLSLSLILAGGSLGEPVIGYIAFITVEWAIAAACVSWFAAAGFTWKFRGIRRSEGVRRPASFFLERLPKGLARGTSGAHADA
ncbi:hypothetical protein GC170_03410 [bacterium]|nr:hypothetical protein [bacterium]